MGTLCSIQSGGSDTKDAVADGPYAFFDRSKTVKRSSRYLRDCEALIIPGEGTEFLPRHFIGKFDLHQRAYALFDFCSEINVKFLYYYLHHSADYFPRVAVGATVKSLRLRHFQDLPIAVTDIKIQRRIVTILDEAFADIATAKANAEKNLQNARDLFDSHLQEAFTQQAGWQLKSFGELAEFRNGINFTKSSKGSEIKIVGVRDFQKNFWAPLDDLETIIPDGEIPASDLIESGDLLFVRSNGNPELIGRSLLVGDLHERITHSGFTIKARLRDAELSPVYVCHYLKSGLLRREMIEGGNGANIKSLNQGTLSRLRIAFPDNTKQRLIVGHLNTVQTEIAELESIHRKKLTALDDLKKSLLHRAFSGQLTSRTLETFASTAPA